MFTMMAHGYVAKQPELVQVNANSVKVEFDLLDKRNVRSGGEYKQVIEAAKFVAWGDDARRLSEQLIPGKSLSVTGQQETSWWTDGSGTERHRTVFKVLSYQFDQWDRNQQRSHEQAPTEGAGRSYAPQGASGRAAPGNPQERPAPERSPRFPPRAPMQERPAFAEDRRPPPERRPLPLPARASSADITDDDGFVRY